MEFDTEVRGENSLPKPRIAILDADPIAREELRLMAQLKAEVEVFSSEDDFQRSSNLPAYDCLLVDSFVARRLHLRLLQANLAMPLIYLTAQPSTPDAVAAIKLGAIDYLPKPVAEEALFSALDAATRQKRSGVPDRFFKEEIALDSLVDGMERELICDALQRSHGVVGGRNGAAAMLGVTRTGLLYKMKRLGVSRALVVSEEDSMEDNPPAPSSPESVNSSTTT
jgi:DNA-binding NtrC family response regulator